MLKIICYLKLWLISSFLFISSCSSYKVNDLVSDELALEMREVILKIPEREKGIFVCKESGYCYLKVSNRYISDLVSIVKKGINHQADFQCNPAPYLKDENSIGAHVSIFYEGEWKNKFLIKEIGEIGQTYQFYHEQRAKIVSSKDLFYLVLPIKSPELEKLRMAYQMAPLLNGYDFHITVAVCQ